MSTLDLGLIGNGTIGALIDPKGRVAWCCLPRFDGDPVFSALLGGDEPKAGFFDVELLGCTASEQRYLKNTAILQTVLRDDQGNALEILDFMPRYRQFGRVFRPMMLIRTLRRLTGSPRIRVRVRPTFEYGNQTPRPKRGSNHCRFVGEHDAYRLTTDLPLTYVLDETPFLLTGTGSLIFGIDESLTVGVGSTVQHMFEETKQYWLGFSRSLSIPFEWQREVIRAAITLKLCAYEETGAIVAAMTTSIPEFADSGRNWDYRFCWLRDAYFVVNALNRLGATRTMEHHIRYILDMVANAGEPPDLQPLYGLGLESGLTEVVASALPGYRGMGPVRVGNLAYLQVQHDIYGAAILACTQSFFDERFEQLGDVDVFRRLEKIGEMAVARFDQPDAGLWELRHSKHVHTFSALMCWVAADRLARIAERLQLPDRTAAWRGHANIIHARICAEAFNTDLNAFVSTFGGADMDASLLLMHEFSFVTPEDPRFVGTVEAIERTLKRGDRLFRYVVADDFGEPETAFNVCTFWFIDALAAIGRRDEARVLFSSMLAARNHLGLLSEDIDPSTGEAWGNFPQTYSMVGLINSAMRLSHRWQEGF